MVVGRFVTIGYGSREAVHVLTITQASTGENPSEMATMPSNGGATISEGAAPPDPSGNDDVAPATAAASFSAEHTDY